MPIFSNYAVPTQRLLGASRRTHSIDEEQERVDIGVQYLTTGAGFYVRGDTSFSSLPSLVVTPAHGVHGIHPNGRTGLLFGSYPMTARDCSSAVTQWPHATALRSYAAGTALDTHLAVMNNSRAPGLPDRNAWPKKKQS